MNHNHLEQHFSSLVAAEIIDMKFFRRKAKELTKCRAYLSRLQAHVNTPIHERTRSKTDRCSESPRRISSSLECHLMSLVQHPPQLHLPSPPPHLQPSHASAQLTKTNSSLSFNRMPGQGANTYIGF